MGDSARVMENLCLLSLEHEICSGSWGCFLLNILFMEVWKTPLVWNILLIPNEQIPVLFFLLPLPLPISSPLPNHSFRWVFVSNLYSMWLNWAYLCSKTRVKIFQFYIEIYDLPGGFEAGPSWGFLKLGHQATILRIYRVLKWLYN